MPPESVGDVLTRRKAKRVLQQFDDWEFEHFVADLWARQGWETEVEQQSDDAGVDVRAVKTDPFDQKVLLQAKRYDSDNRVGGPEVQQYAALKQQEPDTDYVIVVTTSEFTDPAYARADEMNVKLVDGTDLVDIIREYDAWDLFEKYCPDDVLAEVVPAATEPVTDRSDGSSAETGTATATRDAGEATESPEPTESDPRRWYDTILTCSYIFLGWVVIVAVVKTLLGQFPQILVWLSVVPSLLLLGGVPISMYYDLKIIREQRRWLLGHAWFVALVGSLAAALSPWYSTAPLASWFVIVPIYAYTRPSVD